MLSTALLSLALAMQPSFPYVPGEHMGYGLNYLGMRMGVASIDVLAVEEGLVPVRLQAHTTGLVGLFNLRQSLVSRVDPASGFPGASMIQGIEGSYKHTDTTRFDRAAGKAVVREVGKFDNTYEIEVPSGAIDFVGLVFKLRTEVLGAGATYTFDVLSGRDVRNITVTVLGREQLDTRIGKLSAIKVRIPTAFSGKFSEKNPTEVWFSDDERRIVLRIVSDFAVGHASADITEYKAGSPAAPETGAGPEAPAGG